MEFPNFWDPGPRVAKIPLRKAGRSQIFEVTIWNLKPRPGRTALPALCVHRAWCGYALVIAGTQLSSERAVQMNIVIVRAFVNPREILGERG